MTRRILRLAALALALLPALALTLRAVGQDPADAKDRADAGRSFILPPPHSAEEDRKLLELFDGLRVADVSDGMDAVGLQDVGLMSPEIHPLWRDVDAFAHRVCGIAVTVRYVPTNRRAGRMTPEEFKAFAGRWYDELSPEPFVEHLRPGSVVVIDGAEDGDTGTIGSNNAMLWKTRGAVGIVTSGGARDTDEVIKEKIPLYLRRVGRGIRPGRNQVESVNRPVTCGGVLVRPGDVIVADGDGVAVVPREQAEAVARLAREVHEADKAGRRELYKRLGLPPDNTVAPRRP
jgi:regulator of RNase E activity RraA